MFVDEADGIMGKRQDLDQKFVRSMLSEFLREWDGAVAVNERMRSPFIVLASNTPWDIDSAALRRAPVRIRVPLPSEEDRVGIFGIMLRDEQLAPDITIEALARATPNFSGSDIKNLCVAAATRCIQEQTPGQYHQKRVLTRAHFLFAMQYVKASTMDAAMAKKMEEFQEKGLY
jgi:SpoVK/Ycf46/Vps4 family AAA+-type ATPase